MRFTLCKLFLVVTMAALASAGMTLHTRLWAEAIVSFSIVLYTAVAISAFRAAVIGRAFRIAFAAVGRGHFCLVALQFVLADPRLAGHQSGTRRSRQGNDDSSGDRGSRPRTRLNTATTAVAGSWKRELAMYVPAVDPSPMTIYTYAGVDGTTTSSARRFLLPPIPAGAFLIVGHCVWSWLLALAAGCFAAFVCRPRSAVTPVGQS